MHQLIRYGISAVLVLIYVLHLRGDLPLGLMTQVENSSYDARVRLTMSNTIDPRIVIVDIDERSTQVEGQFPWPRRKLATIVDHLFDAYDVAAVGFDIVFPEIERNALTEVIDGLPQDQALRQSLRAAAAREPIGQTGESVFADAIRGRPVVLGYVFQGETGGSGDSRLGALPSPLISAEDAASIPTEFISQTGYTGNVAELQAAASSAGFFDNPTLVDEIDGVYRRVPALQRFDGAIYPSLALELARQGLGNPPITFLFEGEVDAARRSKESLAALRVADKRIPVDDQVSILVPYRGGVGSFPYVSATDVIQRTADADVLKGAIVLVGTSAPGLFDLRSTPVGGTYTGVEVHANIMSGILDERIKYQPAWMLGAEAVMIAVLGALMAWLFPRVAPAIAGLIVLGLIAATTLVSMTMWQGYDIVVPLGGPVLGTLALFLMHLLYGYFIERRGKREVTRIFGQYVPPELVDELAERPEALNMEGESREMTVLFSDVRGFTTISEGLESRELADLMNEFLTPLTRVIHEYRGTIDKYMGDAIMAFWGAPLHDPEHARNTLEAGLAMLDAVQKLDAAFEKRGWPKLRIGVGASTGKMSVGNMGSQFRMAYTVMGDTVNLASRLEGQTKTYGVGFIVAESTQAAVPEYAYRELDRLRVKGRTEPVTIYEPIGRKTELDGEQTDLLKQHRQALRAYRAQRWDEAETAFYNLEQRSPNTVNRLYTKRIVHFRKHDPGADWDGVFTATSK